VKKLVDCLKQLKLRKGLKERKGSCASIFLGSWKKTKASDPSIMVHIGPAKIDPCSVSKPLKRSSSILFLNASKFNYETINASELLQHFVWKYKTNLQISSKNGQSRSPKNWSNQLYLFPYSYSHISDFIVPMVFRFFLSTTQHTFHVKI